jgi:hypothetical protein
MILTEAYDYMDLLLDKADQPYFTTEEKDKFLNIAISDFISYQYQKMTADEDSRRALSGCIDWQSFWLTEAEIIGGNMIHANSFPALSEKYDDSTSTDTRGYFIFGNQYVLPKQHLYVLSIALSYYNKDDILDATGNPYPGVTVNDVVLSPGRTIKNKSTREHYEDEYSKDPFNTPTKDSPHWSYIENRLNIYPSRIIRYINMQVITLPTVEQAFSSGTVEGSTAPESLIFAEHYQKQILQLAVEKMTQVDVGLMTPTSQ